MGNREELDQHSMPITSPPNCSLFPIPYSLGILGGTFDPIHTGHLIIAEEARCRFGLDKVIFVPAGIPPHKPDEPISDREHRYKMTALAIEDNPAFEISRIEIERQGPSYSVDTLTEFKRIYGEDTCLYFIMGMDSILEILTWHEPEKLIKLTKIVAAARPGYSIDDVKQKLPSEFLAWTVFLETPGIYISSTDLRKRAAAGMSIKYLVPRAVEEYIIENKLYKADK